jgi:hypothetical protein
VIPLVVCNTFGIKLKILMLSTSFPFASNICYQWNLAVLLVAVIAIKMVIENCISG